MKKILILSSAFAIAFTLSTTAQVAEKKDKPGGGKGPAASKGKGGMSKPTFKELDTNNDQKISRVEFGKSPMAARIRDKAGKDMVDRIFKKRDSNDDGSLSPKEYNAEANFKGKGGMKGKGKGKGGMEGKGKGKGGFQGKGKGRNGEEGAVKPKRPGTDE